LVHQKHHIFPSIYFQLRSYTNICNSPYHLNIILSLKTFVHKWIPALWSSEIQLF
jgi:hypothetical protein